MGRKLSSDFAPTAVVGISEKVGGFVQGTLLERKEVTTQFGQRPVYALQLEDTDMPTRVKKDKEYVATDVAQGDKVSIFAPSLLDKALMKAEAGERVKIVYTGKGKAAKGRSAPHTFEVEVL